MGIILLEHTDKLYWLGRYTERVYTTLRLFSRGYDIMIDLNSDYYVRVCEKLDIPNIYSSSEDFTTRYCFDTQDINSIYNNLIRAYDNAIVLREEISSETLAYIQLAIYDMQKASISKAPLIELQKVMDDLMAFWGMIDDCTDNRNTRNIIKTGKHIERLSLYGRLHGTKKDLSRETSRLKGRIELTKLAYDKEKLQYLMDLSNSEDLDYASIVYEAEHLI
ncbi:MAG: alpha-E domain-containing protein [Eubacteriales bacterium]